MNLEICLKSHNQMTVDSVLDSGAMRACYYYGSYQTTWLKVVCVAVAKLTFRNLSVDRKSL